MHIHNGMSFFGKVNQDDGNSVKTISLIVFENANEVSKKLQKIPFGSFSM